LRFRGPSHCSVYIHCHDLRRAHCAVTFARKFRERRPSEVSRSSRLCWPLGVCAECRSQALRVLGSIASLHRVCQCPPEAAGMLAVTGRPVAFMFSSMTRGIIRANTGDSTSGRQLRVEGQAWAGPALKVTSPSQARRGLPRSSAQMINFSCALPACAGLILAESLAPGRAESLGFKRVSVPHDHHGPPRRRVGASVTVYLKFMRRLVRLRGAGRCQR
jgi:hypothetical protein